MSEFQSYEFLAVDRPLTDEQMRELRRYSSRARIGPTSFAVEYNWGSFKGDPADFLARSFDVHVYYANGGTRRLAMGLPAGEVDVRALQAYQGEAVSVRKAGARVLVDLTSEDEDGDWEGDEEWMGALAGARSEVLLGDLRPLYIGWLAGIGGLDPDEVDEDALEPPVPPGLREPTASQAALIDFLRVDADLLDAAAEASPKRDLVSTALADGVASLSAREKDALLLAVAAGEGARVQRELVRRFGGAGAARTSGRRRLADLLEGVERQRERRRAELERREAAERARKAAAEAERRERSLELLATRVDQTWSKVEALAAKKTAMAYGEAVALLGDLSDLARHDGRMDAFVERLAAFRGRHERKTALMERIRKARLGG